MAAPSDTQQLQKRVRDLEHQLRLERARNQGLERGLSALSERVVALRIERGTATERPQAERLLLQ